MKSKRLATRQFITPGYTKCKFEELNHNISVFTQTSQYLNRLHRGRELERNEIDQQWTHLIQRMYPADDPKSYELLAQVGHSNQTLMGRKVPLMRSSKLECPLYDGYWEKRADEKSFFEREQKLELFTFTKSLREPTWAEKRKRPGCIRMRYHQSKEFVVPKISLLALQQLNYLDFVKSVLHANPSKQISKFTMEELWMAVVTKIYHFEDTLEIELKIGEVNTQESYL